jgi:NitT/TauT family transport system substrate-binding protein
MTNLTRRTFGQGAVGLSAAALTGFSPAGAQDLRSFTVAEPVHSIDSLPFYAAMKNGYFEEAGLDISLITTEGGGKHIAAVLAGDAQAYIGGPEHIAFVLVKGGEQLKAVVALSNRANAFMVARTGVEVPEGVPFVEQVRGRKVGVGTRGGTGYSIMLYLLEQAGMDPRVDLTLVEIANSAGQLAAMQAGATDIAMVTEPMITRGVQEGVWQPPFASMPQELGLFAWTTLNVPQTLIDADPALVQAMVDASLKGLAYVTSDPEGARAIAREEFPTLPPDDLEAMLASTMANGMWQADGAIPPEAWDRTKSIVTIAGLLEEDVLYESVFDPQFMPVSG